VGFSSPTPSPLQGNYLFFIQLKFLKSGGEPMEVFANFSAEE